MAETLTLAQFAAHVDVPVAEVPALLEAGLPTAKKGRGEPRVPMPAAVHWYVRHLREQAARTAAVPPAVNQEQFAELVGLETRQARNLAKDGTVPTKRGARNQLLYPLPDAIHAYLAFKEQAAKPATVGEGRKRAEEERAIIDAARARLAFARERAQVMDVAFLVGQAKTLFEEIRATLLAFPSRWEAELVGIADSTAVRLKLREAIETDGLPLLAAAVKRVADAVPVDAAGEASEGEGEDADGAAPAATPAEDSA